MSPLAYIGIGSNLGDKKKNCLEALQEILALKNTNHIKTSHWYENEALTLSPDEKQPSFVNGVVQIETDLSPQELLSELQAIESKMGRPSEHIRWSPRVIDLDILFYGDIVMTKRRLMIPHPEVSKRIFVLKPLNDIAPAFKHPELKKTVSQLYAALNLKRQRFKKLRLLLR
jgi:2-amino-4-hydroxy-6-hydroxymethyldihydropteridine diphosphokinase